MDNNLLSDVRSDINFYRENKDRLYGKPIKGEAEALLNIIEKYREIESNIKYLTDQLNRNIRAKRFLECFTVDPSAMVSFLLRSSMYDDDQK